jgi:hypothetical protein
LTNSLLRTNQKTKLISALRPRAGDRGPSSDHSDLSDNTGFEMVPLRHWNAQSAGGAESHDGDLSHMWNGSADVGWGADGAARKRPKTEEVPPPPIEPSRHLQIAAAASSNAPPEWSNFSPEKSLPFEEVRRWLLASRSASGEARAGWVLARPFHLMEGREPRDARGLIFREMHIKSKRRHKNSDLWECRNGKSGHTDSKLQDGQAEVRRSYGKIVPKRGSTGPLIYHMYTLIDAASEGGPRLFHVVPSDDQSKGRGQSQSRRHVGAGQGAHLSLIGALSSELRAAGEPFLSVRYTAYIYDVSYREGRVYIDTSCTIHTVYV